MSEKMSLPHLGRFVTPFDGREIVYWEDSRSLLWLARTTANKAFWRMARFYEAQSDKFMCGPASIAMVLNALKMNTENKLPLDSSMESFSRSQNTNLPSDYCASFPRYTQRNIFDVQKPQMKSMTEVYGCPNKNGIVAAGLNLKEMQDVLLAHGVRCERIAVSSASDEIHSDIFSHTLSAEGQYIIANFDRSIWGLQGRGHVSPIGAFDVVSQKALIIDVNMCGKWLWIDIDLLIKSMASRDNGEPRGYLIISS